MNKEVMAMQLKRWLKRLNKISGKKYTQISWEKWPKIARHRQLATRIWACSFSWLRRL